MNIYPHALLLLAGFLLSACNQGGSKSAAEVVAPGEAVATVNGRDISRASMNMLVEEVGQEGQQKIPEDKIVDELIKRELLRQELVATDMLKDPQLAAKIENAQRMLLGQAAAEQYMRTLKFTDDELKKEYDEEVKGGGNAEFRARHILVEAEDQAKDIIARLGKGEKFEALAKKLSKDPGSKDKGGELGWFSPQQMVQPFAQAVIALKDGDLTPAPVQTQFGWHVIQREESRQKTAPAFEVVKEQIDVALRRKKLSQHINDLKAKAKVENRLSQSAESQSPAKPADAQKP
jgi:peptidyl-prolyl cis-trans isomerase C